MSLTRDEVQHIADLARLDLSAAELERYREQLSDILDYAKRLQALDTSHIQPAASVIAQQAALRADVAEPGLSNAEVLKNAPRAEQNQFRVPPVME